MGPNDPVVASTAPARATETGGLYVPSERLLLKVTARTWESLGIAAVDQRLPAPNERGPDGAPVIPRDNYVRQFRAKLQSRAAIGTVASALDGYKGVYRVSAGAEPRAVVWHDEGCDVVWLCAGLSYPDGDPSHTRLYAEVQRLHDRMELLPTEDEQLAAETEHFWLRVIDVLSFTLRQARQRTGEWHDAHIEAADGQRIRYARFCCEEIRESDGTLRDNFFVVLRSPPANVPHPQGWREIMLAELFPERNDFEPLFADQVPSGADLHDDEVILFLQEELPPDDSDEGGPDEA